MGWEGTEGGEGTTTHHIHGCVVNLVTGTAVSKPHTIKSSKERLWRTLKLTRETVMERRSRQEEGGRPACLQQDNKAMWMSK